MSYRASDHWPAPIRTCNVCGEEFEAENWAHRTCRDCLSECDETEEGGGEHEDRN